jgi:hypothetical protein
VESGLIISSHNYKDKTSLSCNNNWEEKKKEIMESRIPSQSKKQDHDKSQESKSSNENDFERKDDEPFNNYIKRIRSKYMYDPRPDLKEDSRLWEKVLKKAETKDNRVYFILHGFRCGGAKLEIKDDKVNMKPRIGENYLWQSRKEYNKDRNQWLMPLKVSISEIFDAFD